MGGVCCDKVLRNGKLKHTLPMTKLAAIWAVLVMVTVARAATELTVYQLLAPSTHAFDIVYEVTVTRQCAAYFFNPIRPGSTASKESAIDLATGKPLAFATVKGRDAKEAGGVAANTADDAEFLRVTLLKPVPKGAETRIRILKTYTDEPSYHATDTGFIFDRPLGITRNVVVLPKGYELTGSGSPGIVSTDADGRIRISFFNDRDDQLPVRIVGRKLQ
jgi:hypothetical protein